MNGRFLFCALLILGGIGLISSIVVPRTIDVINHHIGKEALLVIIGILLICAGLFCIWLTFTYNQAGGA